MLKHEELRQAYIPESGNLNTLFVAEAAPDDPERFFYNEDVPNNDWLFLGLAKALYKDTQNVPIPKLRRNKSDYLSRFQQDGYYLIDALDDRLPSDTSQQERVRRIRQNADAKASESAGLIERLGHAETEIILIKATVYYGLCSVFKDAGLPILQERPIPFPGSGRQKEFREELSLLIEPR